MPNLGLLGEKGPSRSRAFGLDVPAAPRPWLVLGSEVIPSTQCTRFGGGRGIILIPEMARGIALPGRWILGINAFFLGIGSVGLRTISI
jgi:hypothetical protein